MGYPDDVGMVPSRGDGSDVDQFMHATHLTPRLNWSLREVASYLQRPEAEIPTILHHHHVMPNADGRYSRADVAALGETLRIEEWASREDWIQEYQRQGFVLIRQFVGPAVINEMRCYVDELVDRSVLHNSRPVSRISFLSRDSRSANIAAALGLDTLAGQLVLDPVIYRLALVVRSDMLTPDLAEHRDPRWMGRAIGVPVFGFGLNLEVTTAECGDVYFQPGSHLLGLDGRVKPVRRERDTEVRFATSPGDVILHNLGVVHGADSYQRPHIRRTVYCSFTSRRHAA